MRMPSQSVAENFADPLTTKVEQELRALVAQHLLELRAEFSATSDLYAEGLDSMSIMQLLILIEERFGVRIPEADVTRENFSTIRHLAALIQRVLG